VLFSSGRVVGVAETLLATAPRNPHLTDCLSDALHMRGKEHNTFYCAK